MGYRTIVASALLLQLAVFRVSAHDNELTRLESAYVEMSQVARKLAGSDERDAAVASIYTAKFETVEVPSVLMSLSDRDLQAAFRAASDASFYRPDGPAMNGLRNCYAELARRSIATQAQTRTVYEALFQARAFSDMSAFRDAHTADIVDAPVQVIGGESAAGLHRELSVIDARHLIVKNVRVGGNPTIVVISHPLCHFSRWAAEAIEADPELSSIFDAHSTWVAPADRNLSLQPFVDWKSAHPHNPIGLVGTNAGWPEVQSWQTPTFLFFRNGKLVATVIGWQREGNGAAIRAAWKLASQP